MSQHGWSDHRVRNRNLGLASRPHGAQNASRRERAAARKKKRAHRHLERIRGERSLRPAPNLSWIASIATVVSLAIGAVFGTPIVATARSWITGEPVRIEAISVRGAQRLSVDEIGVATGLPRAARLDAVDAGEIERNLVAHPWIAEAHVVALPTSRLLVRVTERVPRAVVAGGGNEGLMVVEASGLPFAVAGQQDIASLPRVIASGAIALDLENVELTRAVALADRLAAMGLPTPTEIRLPATDDPEGFTIRLPAWRARVVLGTGDLDARLKMLVELAASGRDEVTTADTIDLRFAEQAVLRSAPSPKGTAQAAAARGRAMSSKPRPTG